MNSKTGFLLGAGASYELGLPLVDELTLEFKSALLRVKDAPYFKLPEEIESIIVLLLNDEYLNYEDVIGRIEVEIKRCRSGSFLYQKWHGLLSRYLEAVYVLLLERHEKNKQYILDRLDLLEPLRNYCKNDPLWIFSLNQDLMVEIIAKRLKIPIKYGFYDRRKISNFDFEFLGRENMEKNQFSYFHGTPGINLIKLHGGLDIFVTGDEKNYVKLVNSTEDITGVVDDLCSLLRNDVASKEGVRCTNQITYYDKEEILQFLRMTVISGKHKYSSEVSTTMDDWFFRIYKGHINYVTSLYCIGYSFQDPHVNAVLYKWLSIDEQRKISIVNPFITAVPEGFRHIRNQVEIIKKGFLEFLNDGSKEKMKKVRAANRLRNISRKCFIRRSKKAGIGCC